MRSRIARDVRGSCLRRFLARRRGGNVWRANAEKHSSPVQRLRLDSPETFCFISKLEREKASENAECALRSRRKMNYSREAIINRKLFRLCD